MRLLKSVLAVLALAACSARAQGTAPNPDWKESEVPPPPAFSQRNLVPVETPPSSTLKFGVDPATVAVTPDGIVRFVVIASSASGTINAMYEGIRCSTAELKVYARHHPGSGWSAVDQPKWQALHGVRGHGLTMARTGVCIGEAPNRSAEQIVRDLGRGPQYRFELQN